MWGFFLDNDTTSAEGTTMTAWMQVMREATAYAFDELGVDVLRGEVLAHNEAVRQMNRRYRFTEGTPEEREVEGRTITVIPISLRREDRRGRRKDA
jgi:RimJ/RimL family protein N-acetyltransferase